MRRSAVVEPLRDDLLGDRRQQLWCSWRPETVYSSSRARTWQGLLLLRAFNRRGEARGSHLPWRHQRGESFVSLSLKAYACSRRSHHWSSRCSGREVGAWDMCADGDASR